MTILCVTILRSARPKSTCYSCFLLAILIFRLWRDLYAGVTEFIMKVIARSNPVVRNATLTALLLALVGVPSARTQEASQQEMHHGIAVTNMDRSVRPGDDFYGYANGGWIQRTKLPGDRAVYGVFSVLADVADKRVADLIEETAKSNPRAGSGARKIADLYNSYMDEAGIEAKGLAPLRPHLDSIAAIHDKRELARALGESLRADVDALNNTNFHTSNLFGLWVAGGFNDSDHYAPYLMQGGLQLPDREYYLSDDEHMKQIRAGYQSHISAMLKLTGFNDTSARAARILALEHALALTHRTLADNEDIHKANNTWTQPDFKGRAPGLDSDEY